MAKRVRSLYTQIICASISLRPSRVVFNGMGPEPPQEKLEVSRSEVEGGGCLLHLI